jgi:hypothetical protein
MAKKSPSRTPASPGQQRSQASRVQTPWWRHKFFLGSVILLFVVSIGIFVRYGLWYPGTPHLVGAIENQYRRGVAGAPVMIKEFSDYT